MSFHNYVVEQLAVINENGRFNIPSERLSHEMAEKAWVKYDNDLFQTGRLVTCGLYIVRSYTRARDFGDTKESRTLLSVITYEQS